MELVGLFAVIKKKGYPFNCSSGIPISLGSAIVWYGG